MEITHCVITRMEVFTVFALMDTGPLTTTRHLFPTMAQTVQVDTQGILITRNPEIHFLLHKSFFLVILELTS